MELLSFRRSIFKTIITVFDAKDVPKCLLPCHDNRNQHWPKENLAKKMSKEQVFLGSKLFLSNFHQLNTYSVIHG